MASTMTLGELLLRLSIEGQANVLTALGQVDNRLSRMNNTTKKASSSSLSFSSILSGLTKGFIALQVIDKVNQTFRFFVDSLKDGIVSGFKYNSEMEKLHASMEALTGSQENANMLTEEMVKLAAETPFAIKDFAKAGKTLLGYGVVQEDVIEDMTMLGDISMGDSYAMQRLALAFGQVTAKGKLQAEEVRQMVNAGFNPLMVISEKTGESIESLTDKMRKGGISAEMVREAMRDATSEGGRFHGSMEKLSMTFDGQKEKFKEYKDIFYGNFIKPFYDVLSSKVMPILVNHMIRMSEKSEVLGQKLFDFAKKGYEFAKVIYDMVKPDIINGLKKLYDKFNNLRTSFDLWKSVFESFLNVMRTGDVDSIGIMLKALLPDELKDSADTMASLFVKLRDNIKTFGDWVITNIPVVKNAIMGFIGKVTPILKTVFIPIFERLIKAFDDIDVSNIINSFKNLAGTISNYYKIFSVGLKAIGGIFILLLNVVGGAISGIIGSFDNFIVALQNVWTLTSDTMQFMIALFTWNGDEARRIIRKMAQDFINIWSNLWKGIRTLVGNIVGGIVDGFKSLYNILVGNSIIPDMVNKIIWWFNKLVGDPVRKVRSLASSVKNALSSTASYVSSKASSIYNSIRNKFNSAKSTAVSAFTNMRSLVSSKMSSLVSTISSKINSVKSKIDTLKSTIVNKIKGINLYTAGRNLMNTLINGINSKISSLKSKVSSVASTVKNFLGWSSPTKEGAGKTADKWIPNLMNMMIRGFEDYKRKLAYATGNVANNIASNINSVAVNIPNMASMTSTGVGFTGSNNINIVVNADSFTNGRSVGKQLVNELNKYGVLTHK